MPLKRSDHNAPGVEFPAHRERHAEQLAVHVGAQEYFPRSGTAKAKAEKQKKKRIGHATRFSL